MIKASQITKILKVTIVLLVILSAVDLPVYAQKATREISGVRFDENIVVNGELLKLQNVGLLRYKVIFKGYVAALYLGVDFSVNDVLDDVPKRLELSYFWSISAVDFGIAAVKILQRNLSDLELSKLSIRLKKLHNAYKDVKPTDRYALNYIPGKGTELTLNSKSIVTIMGADFAKAYFSIWLGKKPLDKGLRDTLLGNVTD